MYIVTLVEDIFVPVIHTEGAFVDPRESRERVFVCGALMDPDFTAGIIRRRPALCPAAAADFSRGWGEADGRRMHFLRREPGGLVLGMALLGLSEEEIVRLEIFEQAPAARAKTPITLRIGDVTLDGHTYLKNE